MEDMEQETENIIHHEATVNSVSTYTLIWQDCKEDSVQQQADRPVKGLFQFSKVFFQSSQFFLHLRTPEQGAELIEQHHPGPSPHREERSEVKLNHHHSISDERN